MADQHNRTNIGLHVLVAEDNQVNQMVARKILEKLGCTCEIATNGVECLKLLEDQSFDLVLMDCMMPIMGGLEATRKIRSSGAAYASIPIVAFTANASPEDQQQCRDAGMNDYMDKPVSIDRLAQVLNSWA